MLVMKWDTRRIKNIMASIDNHVFGAAKLSTLNPAGGEDFSEEINRAMLALDMSSDSEADEAPPALSAPVSSAPVPAPVSESSAPVPAPVLSAPVSSAVSEGPGLIIQPAEQGSVSQAVARRHTSIEAAANNLNIDEADDHIVGISGRGKAKRGKVATQGTRRGRSRKT